MRSLLLSWVSVIFAISFAMSKEAFIALETPVFANHSYSFASPIYTAASALKLYQSRSTSSAVLSEIPKGAEVKVVDSRYGHWWQVQYKGKTGYAQSNYLKYSSVNDQLDYDPIYNSSSLYNSKPTFVLPLAQELYEHPSSASAVIIRLPKGAKVKVIDSRNDSWWLVHYNGRTGNVRNSELKQNNSTVTQQGPALPVHKLSLVPKADPTHVTTAELSMREERSTGASVVFAIPKGAPVKVINPHFGDWAQIEYSGKTGYVPGGHFMALQEEKTEETSTALPVTHDVSTQKSPEINEAATHTLIEETSLRAAADSQAKVLSRFSVGDEVKVLDDSGEWWWEVSFNGKRGWVKKRLLQAR